MTDSNIGNWRTIEIFRAGTHTAMAGQEISFSDEDMNGSNMNYALTATALETKKIGETLKMKMVMF